MSERVLVERRGAVTVLTLNRPVARNAIDAETAVALGRAIDAFAADGSANVLVITGAGDLSFCAGADLKAAAWLLEHEYTDRGSPLGFARLDPGKPTIAAVNGYSFAGGMELAAWCDIRIAAANAEFGCLSRRWGVPYVDGGTQRLPRIVGQGNALYLLSTGARIDARRAYEMGFVQEVVPVGQALARALELAEVVAAYPNQPGLRADRAAALAAPSIPLDEGLLLEARTRRTLTDPEMAGGLARFAAGERPRAPEPPPSPVPEPQRDPGPG